MKNHDYNEDRKKSNEAVFALRGQVLDKLSLKKVREIDFGSKENAANFLDALIEKANLNGGRVSLFYMNLELASLLGFDGIAIGVPYICSWFGWEKADLESESLIKAGPDGYGCRIKLPKLRVYSEALDGGLKIDRSKYYTPQ